MDFSYDEVTSAVAEVARKVFKERVTQTSLRQVESGVASGGESIDRALWKELAGVELLSTPQHGLLATCALLVEAGAAVAPVPLWSTLMLGVMPIAQFGTEDPSVPRTSEESRTPASSSRMLAMRTCTG